MQLVFSGLMRKERQRSHPSHATNPDRCSTLTSNRTQIAPFDFADFACLRLHRDRNPGSHVFDFVDFARLWLCRDRTPGSHVFDFADFAPFDFAEMAPRRHRSHWDLDWEMVGFWWIWPDLCLCIEKWYYIFVWKLRKCEKQEENVFSILFSATQPNTRKYFPKQFLEYNQTLENIFLSWK